MPPPMDTAEADKFHVSSDAKRFMWILMEEFTNLGQYPTPKATSLIKAIIAEEDAYVIRNDVPDLTEVWPGAQVQVIPGEGHVMAYIKNHSVFRKAISEMMQATQEHNDAGTKEPITPSPSPAPQTSN
uniref:Hydrolase n=1 Tax=Panagrellus redivivus TaxID=6233 RepID=A0A7E4ZU35_PANRE